MFKRKVFSRLLFVASVLVCGEALNFGGATNIRGFVQTGRRLCLQAGGELFCPKSMLGPSPREDLVAASNGSVKACFLPPGASRREVSCSRATKGGGKKL